MVEVEVEVYTYIQYLPNGGGGGIHITYSTYLMVEVEVYTLHTVPT